MNSPTCESCSSPLGHSLNQQGCCTALAHRCLGGSHSCWRFCYKNRSKIMFSFEPWSELRPDPPQNGLLSFSRALCYPWEGTCRGPFENSRATLGGHVEKCLKLVYYSLWPEGVYEPRSSLLSLSLDHQGCCKALLDRHLGGFHSCLGVCSKNKPKKPI